MKLFEVGKSYEASDPGLDPITVLKRTKKCIIVKNETTTWRMTIRKDEEGNEYVVDSSVPKRWRTSYTYSTKWEV